MVSLNAWMHAVLVGCWLLATMGLQGHWRWVALALAVPIGVLVRAAGSPRVSMARVLVPTTLLVGYGLALAPTSALPGLAIAKCVTFGLTVFACLSGGAALVERFGRDRIIEVWRAFFRATLLVCVVAVPTGLWLRGPEGVYGPTGNPNMFGAILLILGLVEVIPPARRLTLLYAAELAATVALLVATRARASIAAACGATAVAFLLHQGRGRWAWAGFLVAIGSAALLFTPEASFREAVQVAEGSSTREILQTRLGNWEVSWDAMTQSLPFGQGWGVKHGVTRKWAFDLKTWGYGREEGTSWLPVGEELGLPGLFLVAWIWWCAIASVRAAPARSRVLGGAMLTAYFILASFEGWFLSPGSFECAAFWTTLSIVFARLSDARLPVPDAPLGAVGAIPGAG